MTYQDQANFCCDPQTQIWLNCKTNSVAFIVMPLLAAVQLTAFDLSQAALANYSVTKWKKPFLKYRGEVDPDIEIVHLSIFYLLFLPYSV